MAVNMSDSQFKELILAITNGTREQSSFAHCPARFGGIKVEVEVFLAAVTVFKQVENISDTDALEGLPLVLTGDAAIWWHGVKGDVQTWDSFRERLRHTLSPKKPDYVLYQKIVCGKQDEQTPTEIFTAKKRALLSELSEKHTEAHTEISLIFGQIRFAVREKFSRDSVKTFHELLKKARDVEGTLSEKNNLKEEVNNTIKIETTQNKNTKKHNKVRCGFCRLIGHTAEICRKKAR